MRDRDWTGAWQSGGILRTGSAWILYEKCGCESGWYESSEDYMYSLCAVWYYGCHGWLTARTWVFRDADDRISDWCVRTPTVVDIYIFPHIRAVSYTAVAVSDLSGKLDHHDLRTRGLLCDCASQDKQAVEDTEHGTLTHKHIWHAVFDDADHADGTCVCRK